MFEVVLKVIEAETDGISVFLCSEPATEKLIDAEAYGIATRLQTEREPFTSVMKVALALGMSTRRLDKLPVAAKLIPADAAPNRIFGCMVPDTPKRN